MSIFRRGPEVGADSSILKSANFAEYMETGRPVVEESLKSAESKEKNVAGAGLYELWREM